MSKWLISSMILAFSGIANAGTITAVNAIYDRNVFELDFQKKGSCEVVPLTRSSSEIDVKLANCRLNRPFSIGERGDLIQKVDIKPMDNDTVVYAQLKKAARVESSAEDKEIKLRIVPNTLVKPQISVKKFSKGEVVNITLPQKPQNVSYAKSGNTFVVTVTGLKFEKVSMNPGSSLVKTIKTLNAPLGGIIKLALNQPSITEIVNHDNKIRVKIYNTLRTKASGSLSTAQNRTMISLKFNNADVRSVVKAIADIVGVNVVFDPEVKGTVNIDFKKPVFWKDALDAVINPLGLTYVKTHDYLRILPKGKVIKQQTLEPINMYVINLNYANAEVVKKEIENAIKGTNRQNYREDVTVDKQNNALLLKVTPTHYKEIVSLVKKIDRPVKQVMVKARIVEIESSAERDLGGGLLLSGYQGLHSTYFTGSYGFGLNNNYSPLVTENSYGNIFQTPVNSNTLALGILSKAQTLKAELAIKALQTDGKANVVSTPKVLTLNNEEATIEQGIEIPYTESTVGSGGATSYNINFKKASLILKVKPHITNDNKIILNLELRKDSPNYDYVNLTGSNEPAINTRNVKSIVKVANGSTIVIGGIYERSKNRTKTGVPVISKIPLLGWLFKEDSTKISNKKVLMFITPEIVH